MPSSTLKFHKRSPTPHPGPTLNAIPPTDPSNPQHRADNLAACLERRDLGLALARAAAARALVAHEHPETTPDTPHPTDPDLAFARHSRSVRQSVELWEKIVANAFARHAPAPDAPAFDPTPYLHVLYDDPYPPKPPYSEADRGNLYEAVGNLALAHPDAEIPETLNDVIEETLAAHPDDHLSVNFARVCQAFHIEPDRARLQPHLKSQLRPPPHHQPKLE